MTIPTDKVLAPAPEPIAWYIDLYGPTDAYFDKREAEVEFERRNKYWPDDNRKIVPMIALPPLPKEE